MKPKEISAIPYAKPVRVGNYRLWRGKVSVSLPSEEGDVASQRYSVEVLNVSNLDGSWKVQVPQTSMMYGTIVQAYNTTDLELRDNFLGMLFTNMSNVCLISSEALHDAFFFLTEMMSFPYLLLPEKEMRRRMSDRMKELGIEKKRRDAHISEMVEYRRGLYELVEKKKARFLAEYERQQRESTKNEEELLKAMEQDEIAEQAMDVMSNDSEEESN